MYSQYPEMDVPRSRYLKIWRYMNFPKFVALLQSSSLFFSTIQNLQKADAYEGSLTQHEIDSYKQLNDEYATPHRELDFLQELRNFKYHENRTVVVNCWHISRAESAAMWKIYAQKHEGIAIQSTFGRLVNSFKPLALPYGESNYGDIAIHAGRVNYVNHRFDKRTSSDVFYTVMRKPKYYSFEHELRAVAKLGQLDSPPHLMDESVKRFQQDVYRDGGIKVGVDLTTLINKIVVLSPRGHNWFEECVRSFVSDFDKAQHMRLASRVDISLLNSPIDS